MDGKTKKNIAVALTACAIGAVVFGCVFAANQNCDTVVCRYSNETIEVLEKYKKSEIDKEEIAKRLDRLTDLISKEERTITDDAERLRLIKVKTQIVSLRVELYANSYVPYYEIDEVINKIKNNK